MHKIAEKWEEENFIIDVFRSGDEALIKEIFERHKALEGVDPTFREWGIAIYQELFDEMQKKNHFLRRISNSKNDQIGYFHFNFHQAKTGVCWISMFLISPDFQSQKYGEKAFLSLQSRIKECSDITCMWLQVFTNNKAALRFWFKQGFKTIEKIGIEKKDNEEHQYVVLSKPLRT